MCVCVCVCSCEREGRERGERQGERERERDREREGEKQLAIAEQEMRTSGQILSSWCKISVLLSVVPVSQDQTPIFIVFRRRKTSGFQAPTTT